MSLPRGKASPGAALVNTDGRIDGADGAFIIQLMHVGLNVQNGTEEKT